jgi:hypothetical protein
MRTLRTSMFRYVHPSMRAATDGMAAVRHLMLAIVHPDALRPSIVNWGEVAGHLVARMHRDLAARPADQELRRLLARMLALPRRAIPITSTDGADGEM